MRNPIVQVKNWCVTSEDPRKAFESLGARCGVVQPSRGAIGDASSASVPVLPRAHELLPFIQGYRGKAKMADQPESSERLKAA